MEERGTEEREGVEGARSLEEGVDLDCNAVDGCAGEWGDALPVIEGPFTMGCT